MTKIDWKQPVHTKRVTKVYCLFSLMFINYWSIKYDGQYNIIYSQTFATLSLSVHTLIWHNSRHDDLVDTQLNSTKCTSDTLKS